MRLPPLLGQIAQAMRLFETCSNSRDVFSVSLSGRYHSSVVAKTYLRTPASPVYLLDVKKMQRSLTSYVVRSGANLFQPKKVDKAVTFGPVRAVESALT